MRTECDQRVDAGRGRRGPGRGQGGAGRLGFALMEYVASLVKVEAGLFAKYSWRSRTIERYWAQIRKRFGTPPRTMRSGWPRGWPMKVCPIETNRDRLAEAVRERCRSTSIEPPTSGQVERVVNSACRVPAASDVRYVSSAGRYTGCAAGVSMPSP